MRYAVLIYAEPGYEALPDLERDAVLADLDKAIEFAEVIPAARLGGAVEVRPVVQR